MEVRQMARVTSYARPLSSFYRINPASRTTLRQFTCSATRFEDNPTTPRTPDVTSATATSATATSTPKTATRDEEPPGQYTTPAQTILQRFLETAGATSSQPPSQRSFNGGSILPINIVSRNTLSALNVPPISAPKELPRTGPTAGRTVEVTRDLSSGLSRLRTIIAQNKLRIDQREQRFHVRPSLKRKRLKSLRHRKRFKDAFKRLVGIAMDMKRKGI